MKGELSYLNNLKGILFSDSSITEYIEREYKYDLTEKIAESNRKLKTFSSGERKKIFLNYCLAQKPDYLIIDNPLDHLDQVSREKLKKDIEKISKSVTIIQLVNRSTDLLPFITNKAHVKDNSFAFYKINSKRKKRKILEYSSIPSALTTTTPSDIELIKMDKVSVSYEDKIILNSISWNIKKGEFWQLVGPNGSGKSTLLAMISGDNPKGYGQNLFLFGKKKGSGESIWEIKKKIGVYSTAMTDLFQKRETVENMILSGYFDSIGLYTEPTSLQRKIVEKWLEFINMTELKNNYFKQISIGQQRIVLIIRAIIKHPIIAILDEPFEGLDDENANLVGQLIAILAKETNITIICVSHRVEKVLNPNLVYELIPTDMGSIGRIRKIN
jgi:molybdate transport system ATP-binding protein